MDIFLAIALFVVLFIAAVNDWRDQKIPNVLTLPCFLALPAYHSLINGWSGFLFCAGGIGLGIGLLILPYLMGGMGAGDAKLMGAIGGFIGAKGVLYAFVFTAIVGGIYALLLMVIYRERFKGFFQEKKQEIISVLLTRKLSPISNVAPAQRPRLCYGMAIAIGTSIYILLNITGAISVG